MTMKRMMAAAAAVAIASLVSAGITQPAFAAASGPSTTFGAPHLCAQLKLPGPGYSISARRHVG